MSRWDSWRIKNTSDNNWHWHSFLASGEQQWNLMVSLSDVAFSASNPGAHFSAGRQRRSDTDTKSHKVVGRELYTRESSPVFSTKVHQRTNHQNIIGINVQLNTSTTSVEAIAKILPIMPSSAWIKLFINRIIWEVKRVPAAKLSRTASPSKRIFRIHCAHTYGLTMLDRMYATVYPIE